MSHRVTIPDGHVALIVPVRVATEIESYARLEREKLRKKRITLLPILGILGDLQLAASDALAYSYQPESK
jgi:hypothetical protein